MEKNRGILVVIGILFMSMVSANGLTIDGDASFSLNKTVGVNENIIFTLKNTDSVIFRNISFEDNSWIEMDQIDTLLSGESVNVTARVISNVDINENVKIKGYYESNLGVSNDTYEIDVRYDTGVSNCHLSIIQGDTIRWINHVSDEVKMINLDTNGEVATISQGSNYTSTFNEPLILNYRYDRRGFTFTENCQLIVLGDSGLIHNPAQDTFITLIVKNNYDPTTLSSLFIETAHTMNFNEEEEGIFTIKNTGNNTAKNIHFSGDWFSFSANDFDLTPGATKGMVYTIKPLVTSTNDTNMSHMKNISISGNFDTIRQTIDVFIRYVDIDSGNYSTSTTLNDLLLEFCEQNPSICNPDPVIVYQNPNNTLVNVTTSTNQLKEIFTYLFEQGDEMDIFENYMKEEINRIYEDNNITMVEMNRLVEIVDKLNSNKENSNSFGIAILGFLIVSGIAVGGAYLVFDYKKKKKEEFLRRY